jgi:hypothetical protein
VQGKRPGLLVAAPGGLVQQPCNVCAPSSVDFLPTTHPLIRSESLDWCVLGGQQLVVFVFTARSVAFVGPVAASGWWERD